MKPRSAHGKLLGLLYLLLIFSTSLVALAGCGGFSPDQPGPNASPFQSYDQVVDAFDQIVPGMTNAQDLANLGFDPRTAHVDVLSHEDIEARFMRARSLDWEQLDPAVRACIQAEAYCTGYVFHPSRTFNARKSSRLSDLLSLGRIGTRWSADITLLVMNGRVVHKVFSGTPHDNPDEGKQSLRGPALARAAQAPSY